MSIWLMLLLAATFPLALSPAAEDGAPEEKEKAAAPVEPAGRVGNPAGERPPQPVKHAVWIKLTGEIDAQRRMFLTRRLEAAVARGGDLVVIEIDSPGGTLPDSLELSDYVLGLTDVYTVAYVPNKAYSGAALLALSCHEIVMGRDAKIGDAIPIRIEVQRIIEAREKIDSVLAPHVRNLAQRRGRPPALAEAMVKHDLPVYHVRHKVRGDETYMSQEELKREKDDWEKLDEDPIFETREGHALTVTGPQAVEIKMAEDVLRGEEEIIRRYNLTDDFDHLAEESWIDSLVYYLHNPLIIGLLFTVGLVAMYVELNAPGIGGGAAVAILCFALYFWSHWAAGTAGALEIVLFCLGVLLVLLEVFIIPGFGVAGILGGMSIVAGLLLASQQVVLPTGGAQYDMHSLRNTLLSLVGGGGAFLVVAFLLRRNMKGGRPLFGKLVLTPPEPDSQAVDIHQTTDPPGAGESLAEEPGSSAPRIGQRGTAATTLRPAGKVRFGGQTINVVAADGEYIEKGETVEVVATHGSVVEVRKVPTQA